MSFIFRTNNKENYENKETFEIERKISLQDRIKAIWNMKPITYRPRIPLQQLSVNVQDNFIKSSFTFEKKEKEPEIPYDPDPQKCAEYAPKIYEYLYHLEVMF